MNAVRSKQVLVKPTGLPRPRPAYAGGCPAFANRVRQSIHLIMVFEKCTCAGSRNSAQGSSSTRMLSVLTPLDYPARVTATPVALSADYFRGRAHGRLLFVLTVKDATPDYQHIAVVLSCHVQLMFPIRVRVYATHCMTIDACSL